MRTAKYLKRGSDRLHPEVVELSTADALDGGYHEDDALSLITSSERAGLDELATRARSARRDLTRLAASLAKLEADPAADANTVTSTRRLHRQRERELDVHAKNLTATADRLVALAVAGYGEDHPQVLADRRTARGAYALAGHGQPEPDEQADTADESAPERVVAATCAVSSCAARPQGAAGFCRDHGGV